jgi:uncharacterized protein
MEFELLRTLLYALWGLVVGLMVGFTAIGKGILGTPGLMLFFGLDSVIAVGTMGLAGAVMMLSSVVQHYKEKNIEWRIAGLFSITAIPASYLAAHYSDAINEVIPLKFIIGVIILLSTGLLFYRYVIMKPNPRELSVPKWKLVASPFIGLVMGALIGATSISGSIIVIVFLLVLQLPSPISVGTTSVVAAVSLAIAAVAHISEAHIDWMGFIGLTPGVIVGAMVGSRFVNRVPRNLLRYGILIILVAAGVMVFLK